MRRAEQLELVDITPEALRRRLAHGNVYAARQGRRGAGELLPAVEPHGAARAGAAVGRRRGRRRAARATARRHVTDEVWETRERVVVALTGGPESGDGAAPRRADREAVRAAELLAVHVLRGDGLAGVAGRGDRRGCGRSPRSVGASFHTVVGEDVPDGAAGLRPRRQRHAAGARHVAALAARAAVRRGHRRAGGARVRARSTCTWSPTPRPAAGCGCRRCGPGSRPAREGGGLGAGAARCRRLATGLGTLLRDVIGLSTDVVLFFLATVVVALVGGLGPALLAAVLGRAAAELLLHPAAVLVRRSAQPENVVTVVAMAVVAGARRARGGPGGAPRRAGHAGAGGGRAAGFVRAHRADQDRSAAAGCWRRCGRRSGSRRWRCWSKCRRAATTGRASRRRGRRAARILRARTSTWRSSPTCT